MPRGKKGYSKDQCIAHIKSVFTQLGRVPKETEIDDSISNAVRRHYGSFQNAVKLATGLTAPRHYWNDDELLLLIKSLYLKENIFPSWERIRQVKPSLTETIRLRFGGLDDAIERAIGKSPRSVILEALIRLTPSGCPDASSDEIRSMILRTGVNVSNVAVGRELNILRVGGYVNATKSGTRSLWSATSKGRKFILERQVDGKPAGR